VARPGDDTVSRIKQALPLLDYAETLTTLTTRDGRFYHGQCPIPGHTKHRINFYVDVQRGVFKCYGCGNSGDVINLYSLVHNVMLAEAISRLAREVLK
jgi:DNA primase